MHENFILLELLSIILADQSSLLSSLFLLDIFLPELDKEKFVLGQLLFVLFFFVLVQADVFEGFHHHFLVHFVHLSHRRTASSFLPSTAAFLAPSAASTHHTCKHFLHCSHIVKLHREKLTDRKSSRNSSKSPKSPIKALNSSNSANSCSMTPYLS